MVETYSPYGFNEALRGLEPMKPFEGHYVTNPNEIKLLLESPPPEKITAQSPKVHVYPPKTNKMVRLVYLPNKFF